MYSRLEEAAICQLLPLTCFPDPIIILPDQKITKLPAGLLFIIKKCFTYSKTIQGWSQVFVIFK